MLLPFMNGNVNRAQNCGVQGNLFTVQFSINWCGRIHDTSIPKVPDTNVMRPMEVTGFFVPGIKYNSIFGTQETQFHIAGSTALRYVQEAGKWLVYSPWTGAVQLYPTPAI